MSNSLFTPESAGLAAARPWSGTAGHAKLFMHVSAAWFPVALVILDFMLIGIFSFIMLKGWEGSRGSLELDAIVAFDVTLLGLGFLKINHFYKVERLASPRAMARDMIPIWSLIALAGFLAGALLSRAPDVSMLWLAAWTIYGLAWLVAARLLAALAFALCVRRGRLTRPLVIIGSAELAAQLRTRLEGNKHGIRIEAVLETQRQAGAASSMEALLSLQQRQVIDTIVIALPPAEADGVAAVIRRVTAHPVKIRLLAGPASLLPPRNGYVKFGELPGMRLAMIADHPIPLWGRVVKNLLDRFVALMALLAFGPLMLICVAGIKLNSPGPVLFRQRRIGYRNRIFNVYKFRSMHRETAPALDLTVRNDPRIFAFGHVLRKLSFDELPQLFNVLKGNMSLVGPRPHMPEARAAGQYYYDIVTEYPLRHHVKPGITGWAQVNGWRGPTETEEQIEERVRHDLYYIDNWSLALDVKILVKTLFVGFFGNNES